MDFEYDAVIIGAGTAGLSAGAVLQKAGKKYIILDKKDEVGLPVRSTGAVSLEWVRRIGMPTDPSIVASEIRAMSFRTDTGRSINMSFNRAVGLVYDFTKYEKFLSQSLSGKLNVKMKTRVKEIGENSVTTDTETLTAKYIILASGPQSNFGQKLNRKSVLVAYEETRKLPPRDDYQMILWFSDLAPGGYFWDFADSDNSRKVGVCYYPLNAKAPKDVLAQFTNKFPELGGEVLHTMAHQIPLARPMDTVVTGNRLYTGDMVNAVLNTTAGGLQGAFWSGKSAAEAVLHENPSEYQKVWDTDIKPWLLRHHELHQRIHRKGAKSVAKYITLAKFMPKSMQKKIFGGL
jgi:digeranylgeranylglycerophospholipid reductase